MVGSRSRGGGVKGVGSGGGQGVGGGRVGVIGSKNKGSISIFGHGVRFKNFNSLFHTLGGGWA